MEKQQSYTFDEDEIHVLAEALAMYASYKQDRVLPMLSGDEGDIEAITIEASVAQRLAYHFVEEDRGERWEELSLAFQEYRGRPMDLSDVSEYDWFKEEKT